MDRKKPGKQPKSGQGNEDVWDDGLLMRAFKKGVGSYKKDHGVAVEEENSPPRPIVPDNADADAIEVEDGEVTESNNEMSSFAAASATATTPGSSEVTPAKDNAQPRNTKRKRASKSKGTPASFPESPVPQLQTPTGDTQSYEEAWRQYYQHQVYQQSPAANAGEHMFRTPTHVARNPRRSAGQLAAPMQSLNNTTPQAKKLGQRGHTVLLRRTAAKKQESAQQDQHEEEEEGEINEPPQGGEAEVNDADEEEEEDGYESEEEEDEEDDHGHAIHHHAGYPQTPNYYTGYSHGYHHHHPHHHHHHQMPYTPQSWSPAGSFMPPPSPLFPPPMYMPQPPVVPSSPSFSYVPPASPVGDIGSMMWSAFYAGFYAAQSQNQTDPRASPRHTPSKTPKRRKYE